VELGLAGANTELYGFTFHVLGRNWIVTLGIWIVTLGCIWIVTLGIWIVSLGIWSLVTLGIWSLVTLGCIWIVTLGCIWIVSLVLTNSSRLSLLFTDSILCQNSHTIRIIRTFSSSL
jgi:hypothetical protein